VTSVLRFVADFRGHHSLEFVEPRTELKGFMCSIHVAGNLLLMEAVGLSVSKQVEKSPALRDEI